MNEIIIAIVCLLIGFILNELRYFYLKRSYFELKTSHEVMTKDYQDKIQQNAYLKAQVESSQIIYKKMLDESEAKFSTISQKILDNSTNRLSSLTEKNLSEIVRPFAERILEFNTKIEQYYNSEIKERFSLKNEINNIININNQLSQEANNLARALKGDNKIQGNWGEMILQKILEASGLRKDHEFILQATYHGENNNLLRPDVIIKLPENKQLIIDSKVSLIAYERLINDEQDKHDSWSKELRSSIRKHVDGLAEKKYDFIQELHTPELVLLFVPIEGAFSYIVQNYFELLDYAWNKKIVIVGPTTLVATLKTISSVWKSERQGQNVQKMAREAGLLHDKLVSFIEDLSKIGDAISKLDEVYNKSLSKLKDGKGNILSKIEIIRELGAKNNKQLDLEILEE